MSVAAQPIPTNAPDASIPDVPIPRLSVEQYRAMADAGIPGCWIVNPVERQLEVYTDPSGPAAEPDYRQRPANGPEDAIPTILDGVTVGILSVRELLP